MKKQIAMLYDERTMSFWKLKNGMRCIIQCFEKQNNFQNHNGDIFNISYAVLAIYCLVLFAFKLNKIMGFNAHKERGN